jgi:hypothetical protein
MSAKKRTKKPKATPREQWEKLRSDTIKRIEAIDSRTPWSESSADWWVEMRCSKTWLEKAGERGGRA